MSRLTILLFYIFLVSGRLLATGCDSLDDKTLESENYGLLVQKGFPDQIASRMVTGLSESFIREVLKRAQPHVAYRGVNTSPDQYNPAYGKENNYHKIYISSHLEVAASFAIKNMSGPGAEPGFVLKFLMPSFYKGSNAVHVFTREQFPDDRIFLTDIGLVSKNGSNPVTGQIGPITWISYNEAVSRGIIKSFP